MHAVRKLYGCLRFLSPTCLGWSRYASQLAPRAGLLIGDNFYSYGIRCDDNKVRSESRHGIRDCTVAGMLHGPSMLEYVVLQREQDPAGWMRARKSRRPCKHKPR